MLVKPVMFCFSSIHASRDSLRYSRREGYDANSFTLKRLIQPAHQIVTAGLEDEYSYSVSGRSIFTKAFLEAAEGKLGVSSTGVISISEIMLKIGTYIDVQRAEVSSKIKMTPHLYSTGNNYSEGDFFFLTEPAEIDVSVAKEGLGAEETETKGKNSAAQSDALSRTFPSQILIGVAGPFSGPNAAFGEQIQKGVEMAAVDINAAGGINGQRIKLAFGDDVSDPKQGISVANKFIADGVKYVVGHFNSGVTIPASDVYAENGILVISPSSTNPYLTERGLWNTFRTAGRDDQQGVVAGTYVASHFKNARVAIIHDNSKYGQGLADETKRTMNDAGVTEVMYEGVDIGENDFSDLIAKMECPGDTCLLGRPAHRSRPSDAPDG